jgi:hypothetical protein
MRRARHILFLSQVCVIAAAGGIAACGTPGPSDTGGSGGLSSGGTAVGGSADAAGGSATGGQSNTGGQGSGGQNAGGGNAGGASSGGDGAGTGGAPPEVDCNTGTLTTRLPCQLSKTGLYESDMTTLAEGVRTFAPQFPLWTDSAEKKRWIYLPPDSTIDTSNMDFWKYPKGTKFWKEFVRDGKRVETRLIEKQNDEDRWFMVAYKWQDDQKDAIAVPDGEMNASGTDHDIPNSDQCFTCHSQQADRAIGFSAIQLSHDDDTLDWNLTKLAAAGLLSDPPAAPLVFSSGWSDLEKSTFGYMHGNCGTCHNPVGSANSVTGLDMWIKVADLALPAAESSVFLNTVGVDIRKTDGEIPASTKRFDPKSLENSAIYQRFLNKGQTFTMPPLGSEVADPDGKEAFENFIMSLE